jgi:mono/diheme cytochrome c family protein
MSLDPDRFVYSLVAAVVLCAGLFGLTRAQAHAQAAPSPAPPAETGAAQQHGKMVYDAHCVECHGRRSTTLRSEFPRAARDSARIEVDRQGDRQ